MTFTRHQAFKSLPVPVSAAAFWEILADWGALMDWIPGLDENPAVPIVDCHLLPGHHAGTLPCTRRVQIQTDGPDAIRLDETLLHIDHESRRLYYSFSGIGPGGVMNYLATTYVDEERGNRSRVTCSSQFDMPASSELDMTAFIEAFYESAIIGGIAKLAEQRMSQPPAG